MSTFGISALRLSGDLSLVEQGLVGLLVLCTWALLFFDFRRGSRHRFALLSSGALAVLLLGLAVLRPIRLETSGQRTGARVVVLVDDAERALLPGEKDETRREAAADVVRRLRELWKEARLESYRFGDGELGSSADTTPWVSSDLLGALDRVGRLPGDRPAQIVVVSDGRLETPGPGEGATDEALRLALDRVRQETPVHTVALTRRVPRDVSVRAVRTTKIAIAHQPLPLELELGCEPRDSCPPSSVVVRELLDEAEPLVLGRGEATYEDGVAQLELPVTLDRAGSRVLEIALEDPAPDEIPANDRRFLPIEVRRDRIRILHVAGRPTYDVRALRMFLKGDESIDLVSFFILRTLADRVGAPESELSLIPFPVEELFTQHLPSFDAIVLQDIDAREYQLDRHFEAMRRYVERGGGIILVGGPGAFAAGGYAASPLEKVLPVSVPVVRDPVSQKPVEPKPTRAGLAAPMLAGLRQHLGNRLPIMSGSNRLGPARPGALVLWEHPELEAVGGGGSMPLLALGEAGDGRAIALGLDGTHLLRFGELGAASGGRGHTALWEGLLGWLMRDPRYEAARIEKSAPCFAGLPLELAVVPLPGMAEEVELELAPLGSEPGRPREVKTETARSAGGKPVRFRFSELTEGGYVARARIGEAPPTRLVFSCERGGGAWSDSRPDPERLARVARAAGGRSVGPKDLDDLPEPPVTLVLAGSATHPLLPDWAWALLAASVLAVHFLVRRLGGFS